VLSTLALLFISVGSAQPTPAQRNVYVGAYLSDVSDFDLKAGRFKGDLRVWLKWRGDEKEPELLFENGEIDSKDEISRENDHEWHSVQWRVQGTFRGDFPVHAFPFDQQTLPVVFGLDEREGKLVPDFAASGMSSSFSITGWSYEPYFGTRVDEKQYGSDLGSISREGQSARLRRAAFTLEMHRPFGPYLIKFLLPLSLILLMALLALLLPSDRLDVRSSMGITALLSCIAFHYTQSDTLPDVTYLVAADKLFLGAYAFVTTTFLWSVISYRVGMKDVPRAHTIDRFGAWLLPIVAIIFSSTLVANALASTEPEPIPLPEPKPSLPLLRVAVSSLDSKTAMGGPSRRANLVTRAADGTMYVLIAEEAPAMTNNLVRLLPNGGMRVRWRLREDAIWSDGRRITNTDLWESIAMIKEPQRIDISRADKRTVDVMYSDRSGAHLNGYAVYPADATKLPDAGRELLGRMTAEAELDSAAPYMTGTFVEGESLELVRNSVYPGPRPVFEKVELLRRSPAAAAEALLKREIDIIPVLAPDAYELLKDKPGVKILEQPGEQLWVLAPSMTPPWNDLKYRRALLDAVDRDALVKLLAPAPAHVAYGWRDVQRKETKSSDVSLKGLKVTLHRAEKADGSSAAEQLTDAVIAQLQHAGLVVTVEEHERINTFAQQPYEGLLVMSAPTDDPERLMRKAGPEVTAMYSHFAASLYDERRKALEASLQTAWFDELSMVPLVVTSRLAAIRDDLKGPCWGSADSIWWNIDKWYFEAPPAPKQSP
jgi:hypothetical protein